MSLDNDLSMQQKEILLNEYNKLKSYSSIANEHTDVEHQQQFILNMSIKDMLTEISNAIYALISGIFDTSNWNFKDMKKLFFDTDKFSAIGLLLIIIALFLFIISISN